MLNGRPLNLIIKKFYLNKKNAFNGKSILFFSSGLIQCKYMNKCSKHLFTVISFGDRVCFWKYCHYDIDLNRYFFFHPVTVINLRGFFFQIGCVPHVYFNFCVELAELWHVFWKRRCTDFHPFDKLSLLIF